MKKQQLAKVVRKYGKTIQQFSREIPGSFDADMIHDLRVAFKKLRSFLRLLQLEKPDLKMPEEIKIIYRSCGTVRDLQLILEKLKEQSPSIPVFTRELQHELFNAKEMLVIYIEDITLSKSIKSIVDELPSQLEAGTVRQFIQRKVAGIHILLLALEQEEELHAIRKALKDIFYVKKILESDLKFDYPFNEWKSDKKLDDLTNLLGDLNDRYIALSYINAKRIEEAPAEEQPLLQQIRQQWEDEKNTLQQNAMKQVKSLQHFFQLSD